ncbi:MAG: methyltransferase domain-containing protein [Pseudomonadota bacterium]
MSEERSYYLGTGDEEIDRLGLQHRVWRPAVLDAWRRAGVSTGSSVIDAGAGPGFASLDLAEIVEGAGKVIALERSKRFLAVLEDAAARRGLRNIETHNVDLVSDAAPVSGADAAWVRWVFAFLSDPGAVLKKLAAAIRPGGTLIIHEYMDWGTMNWTPRREALTSFVEVAIREWRASGGEPDIAVQLLPMLPEAGLRLKEARPIIYAVQPDNFVWRWPATFIPRHAQDLLTAGAVTQEWADDVVSAFRAAEADPNTIMTTPLVMEIIAERL